MKTSLTLGFFMLLAVLTKAQSVAINTDGSSPDSSAILDVKSTTQGVLIPRLTSNQKKAIVNPAEGLLIYQTNSTKGLNYYNGSAWLPVVDTKSNLWQLNAANNIYNSSAFVGIGNNAPRMALHVTSPTGLGMVIENPVPLNTNIKSGLYFKTADQYYGAVKAIGTSANSGRLGLFTYSGADSSQLIERLTILDAGLVGIGTTNPAYNLDVNGSERVVNNLVVGGGAQVATSITVGTNATVSANLTVSGNETVSGTESVAGALTNNGLGVVVGSNSTQQKIVVYSATLSVTNLAPNSLLGAQGTIGIAAGTFSGTPTAYIGNVISATENGDWYRIVLIPDSVTSTQVKIRLFNPTASTISFSNVTWKVLVVGPK